MAGARVPRIGSGALLVAALALAPTLGAGFLYIPERVENLGGPATPVAYLAATVAVAAVAAGLATLQSSPLGRRPGGPYLHVSRTWGSRRAGFLLTWPLPAAYVALLALLADALGRALRAATAPIAPPPLASAGADGWAFVVLGVLFGLHLLGPAVAGRAQIALTGAVLAVVLLLVGPGLAAVVPGNFDPLFPTPVLRDRPVQSLASAALVALFGLLGVEAGATVARGGTGRVRSGGAGTDPEPAGKDAGERGPSKREATGSSERKATERENAANRAGGDGRHAGLALLVAAVAGGVLATLAALVTLGVIPWARMVFAAYPFADAAASYLDVPAAALVGPGTVLATASAASALVWAASRSLQGYGELLPPLARTTRRGTPATALALAVGGAAVLVVADLLVPALYLAVPGLALVYAVHGLTTAALPAVRPALYERCALRPRPGVLAGVGLVAAGATGAVAWTALTADPVVTLGYTRFSPALTTTLGDALLRSAGRTVLPALAAWLTLGVLVLVTARDYRAAEGIDLPPVSAAYAGAAGSVEGATDPGEGADSAAGGDPADDTVPAGADPTKDADSADDPDGEREGEGEGTGTDRPRTES